MSRDEHVIVIISNHHLPVLSVLLFKQVIYIPLINSHVFFRLIICLDTLWSGK